MHLSTGRGYFLIGHRAGGDVVFLLSQVHQTVDGSWMYFLTPVAQGSHNPLNHGDRHPTISHIAGNFVDYEQQIPHGLYSRFRGQ